MQQQSAILNLHHAKDGSLRLYVSIIPEPVKGDSSQVPTDVELLVEKLVRVAREAGVQIL